MLIGSPKGSWSLELLVQVLAIRKKALGPEHLNVAQSLENYDDLLRKTGRDAEVRKLEARAKAIRAKHTEQNPAKRCVFRCVVLGCANP